MKNLLYLILILLLTACGNSQQDTPVKEHKLNKERVLSFGQFIKQDSLKKYLFALASEDFEGRRTGESGQKKAANYLADFYKANDIAAAKSTGEYFQNIPKDYFKGKSKADSENVIAFIKGEKHPEEYIVISAHYDHLGIRNGNIYFGADDDASGTAVVMQIATAFKNAVENGYRPNRSIVFLHVTGEELGLYGSQYYTENPIFSLDKTISNLNVDMVGRIDAFYDEDDKYIYLIGSDKISPKLHQLSEKVNDTYSQLTLDYRYNDENDPNRIYYRSDHYNFAKNGIPIIFYYSGTHEDYHEPTDTPEKINYPLLTQRTQLIFYTAWHLANEENPLTKDE